MKKSVIAVICAGAVLVVAGGGFGIYKLMQNNADPVEVVNVSSLLDEWGAGYNFPSSGTITANASQSVYVESDKLVEEVFVKEGERVKIGDKLLAYDTTLLEINLEEAKLEKQTKELEIEKAEKELVSLKNGVVPDNDDYDSSYEPGDSDDDYDDDDDDEANAGESARLMQNASVMTAVSDPTLNNAGQSESTTESDASKSTDNTGESETNKETEATSESQTETEEQTEESPLAEIKAYKKLKFNSKPYQGTGTKEDPYLFFCVDGTVIEASFMNKLLGYNEAGTSKKDGGMRGDGTGSYAVLEIREGDSVTGGFVKSININGTIKSDKPYEPGTTWTFTSEGVTKNVPEVDEPDTSDDDDDMDDDIFDDDDDSSYTAEDIKDFIEDKEDDIADMKLEVREMEIAVKKAQRELDEAMVLATINGVVKSVGDPEIGQLDDEPFLSVTSDEGLYVKGTVSELKLDKVGKGAIITGMSYESGSNFEAKITEISEYPDTSDTYVEWGENSNSSKYPYLAYIEDSEGLSNGEYVEVTFQGDESSGGAGFYIPKAYVRSEGGQSYVYMANKDNRLIKQYIKTGATSAYGTVEVLDGLSYEDRIAFPYGKKAKEGAKVVNEGELPDEDDSGDDFDEGFDDEEYDDEYDGEEEGGMMMQEAIEVE